MLSSTLFLSTLPSSLSVYASKVIMATGTDPNGNELEVLK